ncbi:extensin-like [Penaeus chinensis]|uniref:extensin-like n=1 Tax=Penaeus chinensis TaxID=139456 RepID=UPI001FB7795B|nr:extensin-like [Penaeus chinensis]
MGSLAHLPEALLSDPYAPRVLARKNRADKPIPSTATSPPGSIPSCRPAPPPLNPGSTPPRTHSVDITAAGTGRHRTPPRPSRAVPAPRPPPIDRHRAALPGVRPHAPMKNSARDTPGLAQHQRASSNARLNIYSQVTSAMHSYQPPRPAIAASPRTRATTHWPLSDRINRRAATRTDYLVDTTPPPRPKTLELLLAPLRPIKRETTRPCKVLIERKWVSRDSTPGTPGPEDTLATPAAYASAAPSHSVPFSTSHARRFANTPRRPSPRASPPARPPPLPPHPRSPPPATDPPPETLNARPHTHHLPLPSLGLTPPRNTSLPPYSQPPQSPTRPQPIA